MKKQSISFNPRREIVAEAFNNGKNIRVVVGDRPAFIDNINKIASAFKIAPGRVSLSDVCKNLYCHGGHITLSLA